MRSPEEERSVVLDLQKQISDACPYEQEDPNKEEWLHSCYLNNSDPSILRAVESMTVLDGYPSVPENWRMEWANTHSAEELEVLQTYEQCYPAARPADQTQPVVTPEQEPAPSRGVWKKVVVALLALTVLIVLLVARVTIMAVIGYIIAGLIFMKIIYRSL